MERRVWRVETGEKQHVVEYIIRLAMDGQILVDGKVVDSWGSSWWGLSKERQFSIDSKPALLRRVGLLNQHFDLVFEGKVYSQKEGSL